MNVHQTCFSSNPVRCHPHRRANASTSRSPRPPSSNRSAHAGSSGASAGTVGHHHPQKRWSELPPGPGPGLGAGPRRRGGGGEGGGVPTDAGGGGVEGREVHRSPRGSRGRRPPPGHGPGGITHRSRSPRTPRHPPNNCVWTATAGPLIALRDSKRPELPWATVSRRAWAEFAGAVGSGLLRTGV
ncbi:DUF397 domain-containing protein [Streptomyces sp. NPDC096057]|uniref:DUF397 domain-containing protein n=1 Tax=Streptomyces sp. NPDC096057 TaxID=3155543 RepID=UPI00333015D7